MSGGGSSGLIDLPIFPVKHYKQSSCYPLTALNNTYVVTYAQRRSLSVIISGINIIYSEIK
jgi:hypothetical protein